MAQLILRAGVQYICIIIIVSLLEGSMQKNSWTAHRFLEIHDKTQNVAKLAVRYLSEHIHGFGYIIRVIQ